MPKGRKRYTPEEDELIFNNFYDIEKRHQLSEQLGRTEQALSFRFYSSILPSRNMSPDDYSNLMSGNQKTIYIEPEKSPNLEEFKEFPERVRSLESKFDTIEDRMNQLQNSVDFYLKQFSTGVVNIARDMEQRESALSEYQRISNENDKLKLKIKQLQGDYEWQISEMNRLYSELDFWLRRFMKLSSMDKVATLADFLPKMRATFDQFGTIIKMSEDM